LHFFEKFTFVQRYARCMPKQFNDLNKLILFILNNKMSFAQTWKV